MITNNKTNLFYLILIILIISAAFLWSIHIRAEWFGSISKENHQWLTASSIKFVQNWLKDNPISLYFLQLENPPSIEFPTLQDRSIYISYPFGAILPVYLLSLLNSAEVSPKVVMAVNLADQYGVAIILALTVFFLLRKTNIAKSYATLLAIFSGISYIFLPGNLYFHQNVYYADEAVMLPFVLYLFIEVLRKYHQGNPSTRRLLNILQFITAFYGGLCDYLFYCVGAIVFLKRLINKEFGREKSEIVKNLLTFTAPFILALGVFGAQVLLSGGTETLLEKFIHRSGIGASDTSTALSFLEAFWFGHITKYYGKISAFIIFFSIALLLIFTVVIFLQKKKARENWQTGNMLLEYGWMIILPCILQIYLLKNHSYVHSFSTLKLSLILSAISFTIIPVLFSLVFRKRENQPFHAELVFTIALILNTFYLTSIYPIHLDLFSPSDDYSAELFIKHNTSYDDIVFSTNLAVPENPPQQLSYSEKRVYKVDSVEEIAQKTADIQEDYTVNILVDTRWKPEEDNTPDPMQPLMDIAEQVNSLDYYILYKIPKSEFLDYLKP